jgi:hypothetical protein
MTTLQEPPQHTRDGVAVSAFEPRAVTRARGLVDLLVRRPELAGVYKPADVATEAIRWSA